MTIDSHTPLTSFELAALYFAIASFGASCQLNHFTLEGDDTLRSRTSHRGKIHETPGDVSRRVWGSHSQECHSEYLATAAENLREQLFGWKKNLLVKCGMGGGLF